MKTNDARDLKLPGTFLGIVTVDYSSRRGRNHRRCGMIEILREHQA